jgi:hypothetical protein
MQPFQNRFAIFEKVYCQVLFCFSAIQSSYTVLKHEIKQEPDKLNLDQLNYPQNVR